MELLYFIFGAIFIQAILPILDGFCNLLLTWIETKKAKYSEIINQFNVKIRQTAEPTSSPRAIGFCVSDEEEDDEEDEI